MATTCNLCFNAVIPNLRAVKLQNVYWYSLAVADQVDPDKTFGGQSNRGYLFGLHFVNTQGCLPQSQRCLPFVGQEGDYFC